MEDQTEDGGPAGLNTEYQKLKEEHEESLRALAEARRELDENVEAVRSARDELQYFVYAASHDLQQPLRTIATHAQLLQRECPENVRAQEFAGVIVESAGQMNALVKDLLNYSRVGNEPDLNEVQLNGPVQWALYNLDRSLREAGGEVKTGDLPEVLADEKQLVTVFEHLLRNSLLYRSKEPPQVEITAENTDQLCTISVKDNGEGIKPEYQEKVFEPFKRLHSKEIPGSGLGLSICRKIVRAHRGRIWVESDGERGSTVRFTLPF